MIFFLLTTFLLFIIIFLLIDRLLPNDGNFIGNNFKGFYNKEQSFCDCKQPCKCRVSDLVGKPKPLSNKFKNEKQNFRNN